jgi:acetylornithine deacetylase/succinyl-diaminopimelate desuccinylase-like protein
MTAHFGSVWARVSLKGTLVHTAHSAGVTNVILQMNRIVSALEKWLPDYQQRFSYKGVKPTVNIGSIEGGWPWRASRTPAFCNLYVDLRFPPRRHPLDVKTELEQLLRKVREETGISAALDLYVTDAWAEIPEDQYVVKAVSDAHREVLRRNVEHVIFSWSSDANMLTRHGIAAINYGPSGGPGKERRGTMYVPNLIACAKVYALAALDICSQNRDSVRKPFS